MQPGFLLEYSAFTRTMVYFRVRTKKSVLENKDELKSRIRAGGKFVPLERLAPSPQCGFASTIEGHLLTESGNEAKLRVVTETALEVWDAARSAEASKVKGKSA